MGTYTVVRKRDVPTHCQIIQSKMDLKMKLDTLGQLIKLKARLVALGNLEWASIRDTFAPTVNAKTINLILVLAAQERMILYGLDITGAFLTADIADEVYVQLPDGIAPKDEDGNNQIWKLNKTLYGLNRAPKAFYDDLSQHLITHGYSRYPLDPCLFHKILPDGRKITRGRLRHRLHGPPTHRRTQTYTPSQKISTHRIRQLGEFSWHPHSTRR